MRVVDIVGLLVSGQTRIVALGVLSMLYGTPISTPPLPMNPGISGLLAQVNAADASLQLVNVDNAQQEATDRFLDELEEATPCNVDIYLVKCFEDGAQNADVTQSSTPVGPRHLEMIVESNEAWADEITRCLGHRHARLCHERAGALAATLQEWTASGTAETFLWIGDRGGIEQAVDRRLSEYGSAGI